MTKRRNDVKGNFPQKKSSLAKKAVGNNSFDFFDLDNNASISQIKHSAVDDFTPMKVGTKPRKSSSQPTNPNHSRKSGIDRIEVYNIDSSDSDSDLNDLLPISVSQSRFTVGSPERDVSITPPPVNIDMSLINNVITKSRVIVETSPSKQTDYDAAAYAFSDTKYADASKGVPNGGINVQIEFKTFQPDFSYFPPVQMNIISKTDRVQDIISAVATKWDIPANDLVLTFLDAKLLSMSFITESGVKDGDTLYICKESEFNSTTSHSMDNLIRSLSKADKPQVPNNLEVDEFVIQVRTRTETVKVRVTPKTTLGEIASRMSATGKFVFDGDKQSPDTTIGDLDMENMDIVEFIKDPK